MSLHTVSVLVVEDDGLIRMSLVEELENAGFVVLEAGNADEAIKTIEANPYVDAVFTDIDMPGSMDGLKLAKFLHQTRPDLAIMLTSGYLKVPKNDLPENIPFFSKPYEIESVVNHISAVSTVGRRKDCFATTFTS